jgi:hypothetical protein
VPPYGYIEFDLPVGSNMTIKLGGNGSRSEFFLGEDNELIKVSGGELDFRNVRKINLLPLKSNDLNIIDKNPPVLMKSPEIKIVNGAVAFQELHSNSPYAPIKPWASEIPLQIKGKTTVLGFDHINRDVDNKTKYVTYFEWIEVHTDADKPLVKSTGSPSEIPWDEITSSHVNVKVVVIVIVLTALTIYVVWSNPKLKRILVERKRTPD